MKSNIQKFYYGFLIGISNLIPGFSGGTMALILGIYEEFTTSISSFTKTPIKAIKELWTLAIGMVLGIIFATFTIALCLEKWPVITSSFFVGLVIATIPLTLKKINKRPPTTSSMISFLLCAVLSIALPILSEFGFISIKIDNPNLFVILLVIILAGVAAATMIIPAASGSMILLAFGLFDPIVTLLKDDLMALKALDFAFIFRSFIIIVPFIIGAILGVLLIAKGITYLFNHKDYLVWYGILGLLVTSVFTIYLNAYTSHLKENMALFTDHLALNIILSIAFFILGYLGLTMIMKKAIKKEIAQKEDKKHAA